MIRCIALACAATFVWATAAAAGADLAQTPAPETSSARTGELEEITVTARKVEENIQTAPVAVTALTGAQLAEREILQPQDLQTSVPSLLVAGGASLAGGRNVANYNVRGLTVGNAIYLNDAPVAPLGGGANGSAGTVQQYFYDLASAQVVAGPQGTLFGRTSAGGAILYTSNRPTNEFDAFIKGSAGNYSLHKAEGMINVPIVSDVLSVRLAGFLVRRDGYTISLSTGQRLDDQHREGVRLGIDFKPISALDSYTMLQYDNVHENGAGNVLVAFNPGFKLGGALPIYSLPAYFAGFGPAAPFVQSAVAGALFGATCGADAARSGVTAANTAAFVAGCQNQRLGIFNQLGTTLSAETAHVNPRRMYTTDLNASNLRTYQVINNSALDLGGSGFVTGARIKNIVSYNWQGAVFPGYTDLGGSALPLLTLLPGGTAPEVLGTCTASGPNIGTCSFPTQARTPPLSTPTQFSEELNVSAKFGGKFDLLAGIFYLKDSGGATSSLLTSAFGNALFLGLAPPLGPEIFYARTYEKAAFVNGNLDLSDWIIHGLHVSAGVRRTHISNEVGSGLVPGGPLAQVNSSFEQAENRTVTLDWQINDKMLLYARSGTGFQPGGPNGSCVMNGAPAGCPAAYLPETDTDYEIGTKIDWSVGDLRLRTNVAVFRTSFDDIQTGEEFVLPNGAATVYTSNAAKARIQGLELTQTAVYQRLSLIGTYSLNDAKYLKWFGNGPGKTCTDPINNSAGNCDDFSNAVFSGAPKTKLSLLARLDLPTPATWGTITPSLQISYRGPVLYGRNAILDPGGNFGGYTLANARIDWTNMFGLPLDAALFGRNIFNKLYDTAFNPLYNDTLFGINTVQYGEPANFGIEVSYRFGAGARH